MFWLFAEATVNPKYIAEYVFPGVITGYFTHLEYIKLAPRKVTMQRRGRWGTLVGVVGALGLVVTVAWAQTATPKAKLERLKIAVAPGLGHQLHLAAKPVASSISGRPWSISSVLIATPERISPSWPRNGRWRPMGRAGQFGCARA